MDAGSFGMVFRNVLAGSSLRDLKRLMSLRVIVLFTALVWASCPAFAQEKGGPDKKIETLLGTWKIQKVLSGKTEVAKNPTSGQWIEFRNDGTYLNKATSLDSGSYRLNENHSRLYLESKVNPGASNKIVEWNISLTNNSLTMQEKTNENDKSKNPDKMKYVFVRIEKGSSKLNN